MQAAASTSSAGSKHFNEWPNDGGFNALGDTREKVDVPISGSIPNYVAGVLYRTGPGGYKVPRTDPKKGDFSCSHWFDGFTTVHRFELHPGQDGCSKAAYSSYSQVDEQIEAARRSGKIEGISFGQKRDPCDTIFNKFKSVFTPSSMEGAHRANIGVAIRETWPSEIKGIKNAPAKTLTLTSDNSSAKQFDPETLEPLGVCDQTKLHPDLNGQLSGAHAAHDPETGDIFNYNLLLGPKITYRVFRADAKTGKTDILATISDMDTKPAYLHSMFITQNFVILCIWPAYITKLGISILMNRNILDSIAPFKKTDKVTWLVVDRRNGRGVVKRFQSPAFFCFHTINAWEEKRSEDSVDVMCELSQHENTDILHKLYYENMVSDSPGAESYSANRVLAPMLVRWKLSDVPLKGKKSSGYSAAEEVLRTEAGELPRIHPDYCLKQHRYVWGVLDRGKSSFLDGLGKTDTVEKKTIIWETEKHTPGEPIFIPRPGAEDEDEGAVLTVVFNGETGTSYLLCLDAKTMTELGRVEVGKAVGFGFHGTHIPSGTV